MTFINWTIKGNLKNSHDYDFDDLANGIDCLIQYLVWVNNLYNWFVERFPNISVVCVCQSVCPQEVPM